MSRGTGADLLVIGRIATLAGAAGPGWVEAIAVARVASSPRGAVADVRGWPGPGPGAAALAPDEVAIPGLTDAHLHLAEAALARHRVDLDGTRVDRALLERVRAAAAARPTRAPGSRARAGTRTSSGAGRPPPTSSSRRRADSWRSGRTTTTRCSRARGRCGGRHRRRPGRPGRRRDPPGRARAMPPASSTRPRRAWSPGASRCPVPARSPRLSGP